MGDTVVGSVLFIVGLAAFIAIPLAILIQEELKRVERRQALRRRLRSDVRVALGKFAMAAADFERAMKRVGQATQAAGQSLEEFRVKAMKAGKP